MTPAALLPAAVTLQNLSRPGSSYRVGDTWRMLITGSPNQPVSGSASQNGNSLGTTTYGNTDANGQLVLNGSFDGSTLGAWREMWTVGTSAAPVLAFNVAAAPSTPAGSSSPPASSTSGPSGLDLSFLSSPVNLLGISVPAWGVGAAAIAALFLLGGGSRR